jgi:hypothetical protein
MASDFKTRLAAVRDADEKFDLKQDRDYRNGQILASDDDISAWDNYDRYFKFYNITAD